MRLNNTLKLLHFYFMAACLLLGLLGCKEPSPEQKLINQQHDEIMVIHDEVMPKMSDIHKLKKTIKKSELPNKAVLIASLEKADDAMMDWMHGYDKPSVTDENYVDYLEKQKKSVAVMRDIMNQAISQAQKALEQ